MAHADVIRNGRDRATDVSSALTVHAQAIRALGKQTSENIIEIGRHLTEAKAECGHGNWLPWLEREFGWKERSARTFMQVYAASKTANFADLKLPISGLYQLAAPSTPDEARDAIIERAQGNKPVSVTEIKRTIDSFKADGRTRRPPRRNPKGRADLFRREKLGHELVDQIKGTSLDYAKEMDELVVLNRGAPPGEHTDTVKQLVAAAVAGEPVSALAVYGMTRRAPTNDIGPTSIGECERREALIEQLQNEKRLLELKITKLESKIEELEARLAVASAADAFGIPEFLRRVAP